MDGDTPLPPLRDLPPERLLQREKHLHAEISRDMRQRRSPLAESHLVRPAIAVLVVALVALAAVPIGGASLGTRAVDGISGLWETPANQPSLDDAAEDAQRVAGGYYTGAVVNDELNKVNVYLASAPKSVIEELTTLHPMIYVIHNDAPNTNTSLLQLEKSFNPAELRAQGVNIVEWGPTPDGYLQVGVTTDVAVAQAKLDALYGAGLIHVYHSDKIYSQPSLPKPKLTR
jgi:hypothetical protein